MEVSHQGKKETVYMFLATIASKILTYILLIIFANLFMKDAYGKAIFVISLFDLSVFIGSIGVPHILSPWIAKKKEVHSVFCFLLMLSFGFLFVGLGISLYYPWLLPIVLMYPFLFLRNILSSYLQADYKYHINQIGNVMYILATLIFAFIFRGMETAGIIRAYAIGYLVSCLLIIFAARRYIGEVFSKFRIRLTILSEYLSKSLIISVLYISFLFLKWTDTAILGLLSTFSSVATYNVAAPIANVVSIVSFPLSLYLLSRVPNVKNHSHSISILKVALRISLSMTLIALIIINAVSHLIVRWFFPRYIGVEIYIMLLSLGMIFFSLYSPVYYFVAGKLKPEIGLSSIVLAAAVNILLDFALIPFFDIYGIVIATTIAHLIAFTMLFRRIGILGDFIKSYFLVIPIILSYYLGYYGLLLILLSVPLLFILKLFKLSDYTVIKTTLLSMIRFKYGQVKPL